MIADNPARCLCNFIPAVPLPAAMRHLTGYDQLAGLRCPRCIDATMEKCNEQTREVARLQKIIDGMAARVAAQSELLSKRAEGQPA